MYASVDEGTTTESCSRVQCSAGSSCLTATELRARSYLPAAETQRVQEFACGRQVCRGNLSRRLRTVLLATALLCTALPAAAQDRIHIEAALATWDGGRVPSELYGFRSAPDAERAVECILNEAGGLRPNNFRVQAANVPNAAAATHPQGCGNTTQPCERMLLYNPSFMQEIRGRTGNHWSGISIMAHEIGHHLEAHTIRPGGSTPPDELEADEFSGWILRRLGASLDDAQAVFRTFSAGGSPTHPPRDARLAAVAAGWDRANATGDTSCYSGFVTDRNPRTDRDRETGRDREPVRPRDRESGRDRGTTSDSAAGNITLFDVTAQDVNVLTFRTSLSGPHSVRSLGSLDVVAWLHAGTCAPIVFDPSDADMYEYAEDRSDGRAGVSFGHVRNEDLDHVAFDDDGGSDRNFMFTLESDECYVLLVYGYGSDVRGPFDIEMTGVTGNVEHGAYLPDRRWEWGTHPVRSLPGRGSPRGTSLPRRGSPGGTSLPRRGSSIDFGDDSSEWAYDGECDDVRFTGDPEHLGITLDDGHVRRDATDCRTLFQQGRIRLK